MPYITESYIYFIRSGISRKIGRLVKVHVDLIYPLFILDCLNNSPYTGIGNRFVCYRGRSYDLNLAVVSCTCRCIEIPCQFERQHFIIRSFHIKRSHYSISRNGLLRWAVRSTLKIERVSKYTAEPSQFRIGRIPSITRSKRPIGRIVNNTTNNIVETVAKLRHNSSRKLYITDRRCHGAIIQIDLLSTGTRHQSNIVNTIVAVRLLSG